MEKPEQENTRTFKIVVVGAPGTGKTCLIRRLLSGEFEPKYIPTNGSVMVRLVFMSSRGRVAFEVHDLGAELVGLLGTANEAVFKDRFRDAQGLLAVYDCSKQKTTLPVVAGLHNLFPELPTVLCGSKADIITSSKNVCFWIQGVPHYKISAKSNFQCEQPFFHLARTILGDPKLMFAEKAPIAAPIASHSTPAGVKTELFVDSRMAYIKETNTEAGRMYLVVSEHCYGAGLRGIFDNLDAARAYAKCANVHKVDYVIIGYLPNVPGSEVFFGQV